MSLVICNTYLSVTEFIQPLIQTRSLQHRHMSETELILVIRYLQHIFFRDRIHSAVHPDTLLVTHISLRDTVSLYSLFFPFFTCKTSNYLSEIKFILLLSLFFFLFLFFVFFVFVFFMSFPCTRGYWGKFNEF